MSNPLLNILQGKLVLIDLNTPMVILASTEDGEVGSSTSTAQFMGTLVWHDDSFIYINEEGSQDATINENTKAVGLSSVACVYKYEPVIEGFSEELGALN